MVYEEEGINKVKVKQKWDLKEVLRGRKGLEEAFTRRKFASFVKGRVLG